jgi:ribosomal protein S3
LAVDAAGNVYVTGASAGIDTDMDYATIKYTAEGAEAWVSRYNGPGNAADQAVGMAVDAVGNIYVTGQSAGADQAMALATMKYDPDGVQAWITRTDSGGQ